MTDFTVDSILVVGDSVKVRQEEFGSIIVSKHTPSICANHDAMRIWNLCDGRQTLKDIIFELTKDVPKGEIAEYEEKITKTIQWLTNLRLLEIKQ